MTARRAAAEAGRGGSKAARAASYTGISLKEAQEILNIKDIDDIEVNMKFKDTRNYCAKEGEPGDEATSIWGLILPPVKGNAQ